MLLKMSLSACCSVSERGSFRPRMYLTCQWGAAWGGVGQRRVGQGKRVYYSQTRLEMAGCHPRPFTLPSKGLPPPRCVHTQPVACALPGVEAHLAQRNGHRGAGHEARHDGRGQEVQHPAETQQAHGGVEAAGDERDLCRGRGEAGGIA